MRAGRCRIRVEGYVLDTRAIALAVPFFFLLMGIELWISARRRERLFRFSDTITSLACGVGQQVLAILFVTGIATAAYTLIYDRVRVFTVPKASIAGWLAIIVLVDLGYYAYHRASHRINFFWATHVVHHQSEEYNLGTALRQSWFTGLTSWIFYAPLAVLGFSPFMFLVSLTGNTLYQFWIHTRLVGKLGAFESVFNTPSHHRVHHGIDPEYIDKNYAGIFIVWDKLFGTFIEEKREPAYGTVKPLASFNPFWANLEGFARIFDMSIHTRRFGDRLFAWVAPPEWQPEDLGGVVTVPEVDHDKRVKFSRRISKTVRKIVAVHFALLTGGASVLLWYSGELNVATRTLLSVIVLAALVPLPLLLDPKEKAAPAPAASATSEA